MAALRAAELGAATTLVTRGEFGGMAAHDGPVPVRTLAHAARLIAGARRLERYGIGAGEPRLDYPRLLDRVREVTRDVAQRSSLREQAERLGVTVQERAGRARFVDPHRMMRSASSLSPLSVSIVCGLRLDAERIILCAGGRSRRLRVPGADLTCTH